MLQLVLELLSILKSSSSPKVPTALIKVVQLETLCNIPLDEGRQGTTITLYSGEHLCLPELCVAVALSIYMNMSAQKTTSHCQTITNWQV